MRVDISRFALPPKDGGAAARSKLGDLSAYRVIVVETKSLAERGDLVGARDRISDLEASWGAAETELKSRAAMDWHIVDLSVDRAVTVIRAQSPDAAARSQVLTDLVTIFDTMSGKRPEAF
ncbi:MAG: histidine kinase, partial [Hyphomicrobiales bacterium]|nr:histidine kinase [Hyphomicrobiales bacterium]MBV8662474.1 histidine kinase [Hyphomicrobiales bacterium]